MLTPNLLISIRMYLLGTVILASFTRLDGTRQLFATPNFYNHELPALIQDFFDIGRDVDDLTRMDDLVIAVDVSIKHLVVPERVRVLLIGI